MGGSRPDVGKGFAGQARPKQLTPHYKAEGMPQFGDMLLWLCLIPAVGYPSPPFIPIYSRAYKMQGRVISL